MKILFIRRWFVALKNTAFFAASKQTFIMTKFFL
jgi:hypothetical protein